MDKTKKESLGAELLKLGAVLTIICLVVAGIVAYVYESTKEQIKINNMINKAQLAIVSPECDSIEDVTAEYPVDDTIFEVYKALKGTDTVGYIYKTRVTGYKPDLTTLIGLNNEGNVVAAIVTSHAETGGLGANVVNQPFIGQFAGKNTEKEFKVVKTAPAAENEIQAVSGATISSTAVVLAVNTAVSSYKVNVLKAEAPVGEVKEEPGIENMLLTGDEMVELPGAFKAFEVKTAGVTTGYIIYAENNGYSEEGPIEVAVAFDKESKKITNVKVTKQSETKGLGDVIEDDGFAKLFQGKDAAEQEIQVYSGATFSSKGAITAINKAVGYFNEIMLQGGN